MLVNTYSAIWHGTTTKTSHKSIHITAAHRAAEKQCTASPSRNTSVITDAWTTSKQVNFLHNWSVEDTKSQTNFPELARDMPKYEPVSSTEHEWSNNYSNTNGVTKSPTAPSTGSQGVVAHLDDIGRGMSGNICHPERCLWKNNNVLIHFSWKGQIEIQTLNWL